MWSPLLLLLPALAAALGPSVPWGNSRKYPSNADQCFCQLAGAVDDCLCSIDTLDHFNNMKIHHRLNSLLHKDYFRYFHYNQNRKCQWQALNHGHQCATRNCDVKTCAASDLPSGLKAEAASEKPADKYSAAAAQNASSCADAAAANDDGDAAKRQAKGGAGGGDDELFSAAVDQTISAEAWRDLRAWRDHDESSRAGGFCDPDEDFCPDCTFVDLTINPERYTGYAGDAAHSIWRAIYEENCFLPPKRRVDAFLFNDDLQKMCLEKRAYYRAVSGLHTSITIHLCTNHLKPGLPGAPDTWEPNLDEFQRRFDPMLTHGQGPYWLKNLYFVYLLELRALAKVAPYLRAQSFFTGSEEEDKETAIAVKELLNLIASFPDHFDESVMFAGDAPETQTLKEDFRLKFHNLSHIMDCVGCDKCRLWGTLQTRGLGTALKILTTPIERILAPRTIKAIDSVRDLYLDPSSADRGLSDFRLNRNEIVALFNAFGRLSTSIAQVERFRGMMRPA